MLYGSEAFFLADASDNLALVAANGERFDLDQRCFEGKARDADRSCCRAWVGIEVAQHVVDRRFRFGDLVPVAVAEGHHYPSHVVGFRFTNRAAGMLNEKQWYQTDILELTPLAKLPE